LGVEFSVLVSQPVLSPFVNNLGSFFVEGKILWQDTFELVLIIGLNRACAGPLSFANASKREGPITDSVAPPLRWYNR